MADNVTVTNKKTTFDADTNPDIPVATKDIGGYQYQKVLLYDASGNEILGQVAAAQSGAPPTLGLQIGVYDTGSGDFNLLQSNTPGTIPISHESICPVYVDADSSTSGTITTAGNTVSKGVTFDYGIAQFAFYGTFSNAALTFEYTVDGSTYQALPVQNVNDGTVASSVTISSGTYIYRGWAGGYNYRVRCTAITSGTVNARLKTYASSYNPIPTVYQANNWRLRSDEDTGSAAFPNGGVQLAAQDQAYGTYEPIYGFGNSLQTYVTNVIQTVADAGGGASGTLSVAGNTVSAGPDSTHGVSQFQIYGTYSNATVTFEYTIDGSTWTAFPVRRVSTGAVATTFTGSNAHEIFVGISGAARTTRIRLTAITSGSITAGVRHISMSFDPVPAVYQAGTWTVNQGGSWTNLCVQSGTWNVGHNTTGIGDGRKTVTTAGTRVTLVSSTTAAKWVTITAETDNTNIVVVGGSTCVAALATRQGTPLDASQSLSLLCDDLVDIYLDSMVNGEGVTFTYGT
jgi:hypothetical protein